MENNILIFIHLFLLLVLIFTAMVYGLTHLFETEQESKKSKSYIIAPILFVITLLLLGFYIYGANRCSKQPWICEKEPYAVEKIVGLADNNLTNGRFYMRRGYIEDKLYYQYMVELGNGGFVANKVNSADATLFYDTSNYRVEWYKKTKSWLYFREEKTYHKIYIPEGSITDDYMIDLN